MEAVNLDGQEFAASFHGDAEAHATTFSTASTSGTQYGNAGTFGIGTLVVGFWEIILGTFGNLGHVTGLRKHECLLTAPPPAFARFSGTFTGLRKHECLLTGCSAAPPVFAPLRRIQSNRCVFRASFLNEALPEILCG